MTASDVSPVEAMQWAVRLVCTHTGYPLGHVFLRGGDPEPLVSTTIWHDDDPSRHRAFVAATDELRAFGDAGLPGRCRVAGGPVWIEDVSEDADFPRAGAALACGIRSAFAFPIVSERGIEGVMEFFAYATGAPEQSVFELLAHVVARRRCT